MTENKKVRLFYYEDAFEAFIPIPDKQIVSVLKNLQESLLLLKTNTNPKLIVENLLISYPF